MSAPQDAAAAAAETQEAEACLAHAHLHLAMPRDHYQFAPGNPRQTTLEQPLKHATVSPCFQPRHSACIYVVESNKYLGVLLTTHTWPPVIAAQRSVLLSPQVRLSIRLLILQGVVAPVLKHTRGRCVGPHQYQPRQQTGHLGSTMPSWT